MSSVGRVIGTVVGIGALFIPVVGPMITGAALAATIGTAGFAAIAAGAAVGASLLLGPKMPKLPQVATTNAFDRLRISLDVSAPRKIAFGITALPTDVEYRL